MYPRRRSGLWIIVGLIVGTAIGATLAQRPPERISARAAAMDTAAFEANDSAAGRRVLTRMRNVRYEVDPDIVLAISAIDGALLPVRPAVLPVFDDPNSFSIEIETGEIAIDTASLSRLLDRYVFAYSGSAIRNLSVSIEDGRLKQRGRLQKLIPIPFTITASVSVTPGGEIRIRPDKVRALGVGVESLMKLLGLELDDLIANNRSHGVRIDDNDLYLDPAGLLPPPRVRGHLTGIRVESDRLVQVFGSRPTATATRASLFQGDRPGAQNFMHFRTNRLRFGKLTMVDADLLIVDANPKTPFEFSLTRYHEQLVAGWHRTTPSDGLVVSMPDVSALVSKR